MELPPGDYAGVLIPMMVLLIRILTKEWYVYFNTNEQKLLREIKMPNKAEEPLGLYR